MFPERKDASGLDHRMNLITVPSCDEHNLEKSKEDEFLMACITPLVGNNSLGYAQTQTKLRRAVSRTDGRLLDAAMTDAKQTELATPHGVQLPARLGKADMPRLCRALEHVARGLYFHATRSRFIGKCVVMPGFVCFANDAELELIKELARQMSILERTGWREFGANRDVFYATIGLEDQYGLIPMLMVFFGQAEVFVAFQPEGVKLPFRTLDEATPENPLSIELNFGEHSPQ